MGCTVKNHGVVHLLITLFCVDFSSLKMLRWESF